MNVRVDPVFAADVLAMKRVGEVGQRERHRPEHDEEDEEGIRVVHGSAELSLLPGAGARLRHDPRAIAILMGWLQRVQVG